MKSAQPPPLPTRSAGIAEYLKRAFLYRWNMLLFLGGTAAAALSPWPDALLPLVGAVEVLYLGGLVASSKFRDAIDAQAHKEARGPQAANATPGREAPRSVQEVLAMLPMESKKRFEQVRARCVEMRAIASGVRGRAGAANEPGNDLSTPALDRLLWVFLRLLVSSDSLQRFLQRTNADEIRTRLAESKQRLEQLTGGDDRIIRSLQDSVAAQELRLQNYERAKGNLEYVRVELDRIEAKIQVLAESSVNRQDPDFLSSQIDSVTESMQSTEKAISELQQITGLVDEMQEPPAILEADLGKVVDG
jgi:hypothetical protein